MNKRVALGFLGTAALAALFLTALLRDEPSLRRPLLDTDVRAVPHVKDVVARDGTVLMGTLTGTFDARGRPVLLRGSVLVPRGTEAVIPAGTSVLAERDASIVVEGSLRIEVSSWASNRLHPSQRLWHGIVVQNGGRLTVAGATIADATAALTCARGGALDLTDAALVDNVAGVVSLAGSTCTIRRVLIQGGQVGIQVIDGAPTVDTVTIRHVFDGLRVFHHGRPTLTRLTIDHPSHAAIVWKAESPLRVWGFRAIPDAPPDTLIIDGNDAPTHVWHNVEYPTGRVTVEP